jgi:hypothetical protein
LWTAATNTTILSGQGTNTITLSTASAFTTGTLSVRAVSSCGQSAARTLGLSINPATPSGMLGQTTNLCGGGQFTYSVTAVTGATSYVWTVPTGCTIVTNNGNSIVLNVSSAFTTGTLSVRAYNSCGGSSLRSASLTRLPSTPASITGAASVCPNQVGVVFTTPAVSGVTQTWAVPGSSVITAGQGTTSMTCTWGTAAGSVTVRSVNACGQSAALSKAVTLATCIENDGTNLLREATLEAYPNPSNGSKVVASMIGFENENSVMVTVTDVLGKVVYTATQSIGVGNAAEHEIVAKLSAGIYNVSCVGKNHKFTTKMVVE